MLNLQTMKNESPDCLLDKGINEHIEPVSFLLLKNFLSSEECDEFVNYVERTYTLTRGKSRDQNYVETRTSDVCFVKPDVITVLVYNTIMQKILPINENYQRFNLTHLDELQYTRYKEGQYLHLHTDDYFDFLNKSDKDNLLLRKLSISLGLNDDYEGGEFELHSPKGTLDNPYDIRKFRLPKGAALVFPSFQLHQVHPVTKGERKAVVAWFFGPKWT